MRLLFLSVFISPLLSAAPPVSAQETIEDSLRSEPVVQPEIARREFVEPEIDEEDFEVGGFVGFLSVEDFGTSPVYGARLAYHVTEAIFLEAAVGTSTADKTSFELLSGNVQLLTDDQRDFTYYNLSAGYNVLPGEVFFGGSHAFNSQFYLIAGVGSTRFAGNDEFTVNVGAGYRLLINDWLTLHLDARDHMFESDLLGEAKTTHNIELHGGLTFFF
ncbi:MAG: outer membrane beta-barrel domain-containing protein [Candidatus Thiodiazotropha sp. (ex Monitilora ramsayi)]|nr:outer membrane beta-barrel domain-containing protein [Candidatus Thiodiazotropha sp. (ex Monitilora ramsayi)]